MLLFIVRRAERIALLRLYHHRQHYWRVSRAGDRNEKIITTIKPPQPGTLCYAGMCVRTLLCFHSLPAFLCPLMVDVKFFATVKNHKKKNRSTRMYCKRSPKIRYNATCERAFSKIRENSSSLSSDTRSKTQQVKRAKVQKKNKNDFLL